MEFKLYTADCTGDPRNCIYPTAANITSEEQLKTAVSLDHVCAEFRGSRRSVGNFICGDADVFDCDNDHTDDPNEWITPEKIAELFPDVSFAAVTSKSNMKPKGAVSARPRFHVYFPHKPITDAAKCAELKKRVQKLAGFFDGNALDAARFIFGNPDAEILWVDGIFDIDDYLDAREERDFDEYDKHTRSICEGSRNSTMSRFAARVIKRCGMTEKAHELFLREAERCSPPLPDNELRTIWSSALKLGAKMTSDPNYIPPEQYGVSLKPPDYSDVGQARVLSREYENELVYTDATEYMRYDGLRWVESKQLSVGAVEELLDMQLAEAQDEVQAALEEMKQTGAWDILSECASPKKAETMFNKAQKASYFRGKGAQEYLKFVMKRRDMKYIASALQAAKPMLLRDIKDFDTESFLLNTPVATYDLQKGLDDPRGHSADDLITKITSTAPSEENKDLWLSAVNEFFCNDAELIDYVQQIVGIASVGKVYVEALIISYGQGRNGKSTFWNAISRVLGTYSGTISADALTVGCKRNVKPEMAELKGKRLVIAAELEEGMRLNTSVVKQLCSTDEVSAEKKYKDPFKYVPTHTLVLYTNHLPRVGANDEGTWRRLIVIPFNAKITDKGDIKNYADYLYENAGGAILSWIIEGARKAIGNAFRLKPPKCVLDAVSRYREENDWLKIFIDDCCEIDPSYTQRSGEFYQEYRAYAQRTGVYPRSTADFYSALEHSGYTRKRTVSCNVICGLRIKKDTEEFLSEER